MPDSPIPPNAPPTRDSLNRERGRDSPTTIGSIDESLPPLPAPLPRAAPPAEAIAVVPTPAALGTAPLPDLPGYEILGELGHGGMGVVYKARHLRLNRVVALKMILGGPQASPEDLLRFLTEAEAVARLDHPNVVQIHEVGAHRGQPFFSLEYVEGGSLDRKLAKNPQPARAAAALVEILARAMHSVHARGIVHRDLKPANVLLTPDGTPKISDFGLAKRLVDGAAGLTPTQAILGTPEYMAPEQAAGQTREIGPAADLHALGAILYEMLTGRPPFQGITWVETIQQVLAREPLPPTRLQSKVPRDLEIICLKCLEKEPRRRYASAGALAEDLRRYRAGEPIKARPVGRATRAVKWARRNPLKTVLGAAALLAVGMLALWLRAEQRGQQAIQQRVAERKEDLKSHEGAVKARLDAGNFAEAEKSLRTALKSIQDDAHFMADQARLAAQADRVHRLVRFYQLADEAMTRAGEEKYQPATAACERALGSLGFDQGPWWTQLPEADLPRHQRERLRQEAYRQLLLLSGLRTQPGLARLLLPVGKAGTDDFRAGLRVLQAVRALEQGLGLPPARTARILEDVNRQALRQAGVLVPAAADPGGAVPAATSADYFYLGLMHFYLGKASQKNPLHRIMIQARLKDFEGLGGATLESADQLLRKAISLDPDSYWAYWVLGRTLGLLNDHRGAELAFGTCIALKPDYARGHEQRALAVARQAADVRLKDDKLRDDLRRRALEDSRRALACAQRVHDPATYWPRAQLLALLQQPREALEAYALALELEADILEKISRSDAVLEARAYAQLQIDRAGAGDPALQADAHAVLALLALTRRQQENALQAAAAVLALPSSRAGTSAARARALAVRGTIRLQRHEAAPALADFDAALRGRPDSFLAAIGRARAQEEMNQPAQALAGFQQILAGASLTDGQRLQAYLGSYRMWSKLDRPDEARAALAERAHRPAGRRSGCTGREVT